MGQGQGKPHLEEAAEVLAETASAEVVAARDERHALVEDAQAEAALEVVQGRPLLHCRKTSAKKVQKPTQQRICARGKGGVAQWRCLGVVAACCGADALPLHNSSRGVHAPRIPLSLETSQGISPTGGGDW